MKVKRKHFLDIKSWLLVVAMLIAAFVTSVLAIRATHNFTNTPVVFVLAVLMVARFTDGYFYGIVTAFLGTFLVNYAFTFPFLKIDLSLYPICLVLLLTIAVTISMMMSQMKNKNELERGLQQEKMTANLLRSVSHDLRSPLTSIAGSASVYLEECERLSEETKTALITDVRDESQRLIRMVENILMITRVGDETFSLAKTPEAVEEIVGAAVQGFKKSCSADIKIITDVPDELLMVPMDAMLIYQVLRNLMENSVIHGGSVTEIHISAEKCGQFAEFKVTDNGVGIKEDIIEKLFEGVIITPSGRHRHDGSCKSIGIGLSLCSSIIRLHGGTMNGRNGENGGAVFSFTLPLE